MARKTDPSPAGRAPTWLVAAVMALALVGCRSDSSDDIDAIFDESAAGAESAGTESADGGGGGGSPASGDRSASGAGDRPSGQPDAPSGGASGAGAGQAGGARQPDPVNLDEWQLEEADANEVLARYDEYLAITDLARLGDPDALARLEQISDPIVQLITEDWQLRNEQLAAEGLSVVGLKSTANVTSLNGSTESAVVHDCVTEEVTDEFLGLTRVDHIQQITVFRQIDGEWLVGLTQVLHNGTAGAGALGCVPDARQIELEAFMAEVMVALEEAWADPGDGVDLLAPYLAPDFLDQAATDLRQMADDGVYADDPQEHGFRVLGTDPGAGSGAFVVASCTRFPSGFQLRSVDTGAPLADGPPPSEAGSTLYREWRVRVLIVDDGSPPQAEVTAMTSQDVDARCGTNRGEL